MIGSKWSATETRDEIRLKRIDECYSGEENRTGRSMMNSSREMGRAGDQVLPHPITRERRERSCLGLLYQEIRLDLRADDTGIDLYPEGDCHSFTALRVNPLLFYL